MKRTSFTKTIPGFLRSSSVEYLKSNGFKDPDSLLDEAAALSLDHKDLEKFHRRHFTNKDGSVNMELQAAFARVHTVERTVSSYMPILERLALEAECGASAENLKNHIQALKNSFMPLDQTVLIFNKLLKIAPSLTPHPTENLAPAGIALLQALLDAAGSPAAGRSKAIETAIKALFDAPVFGAVRKATVLDEVRQARIYKLAHIKAVNEFDRRLEDALEAAYGTRPKINSNTALRNWDKDTDGKDNSEGFAMLAQLAMDQVDSLTLALDNIDAALDDPACPAALKELAEKFKTVRNVVGPIYEGAGNAVEVLALLSPEERAKAYPLMYDRHFKGLKRKLSGAYEGIGDKMRGLGLYRESCKILGAERENPALSQEARAGLDEAFRTIQKLGFALSKSQTRISYNVYMRMLDNLFTAQPQPAILHKILTDEELDDIAASGGFSSIADPEQQRVLLNEMYHNIQRQGLEKNFYKALRAANPMVMAASGFPDQGFSVCDVLDMRAVFQLMYEEGIISDGGPCSFEIQKLMGLVSGNGLMKHMPLFENLDTYMQASDLSEKFMALDAGESGQFRVLHIPAGIGTGFKGYSVIIPASDSAKEGGDGAKLVGLIGERTLFAHTIKRGEAVQQMNGAGTSLNRSIGDPAIIRRMGAQELKKHLMSRGAVLNLAEPQDTDLARMALTIMYTEQGRGNRLNALSPGQILGTLTARTTEALQDMLDLTGAVPDYTFIDKPEALSPAQTRAFEALPRQKMRRHFIMRHARAAGSDDKILDVIAQAARGPHMIPFTNIMSRAPAKTKKAGMTSERAIGNDISQSVSELFFSGFYGTGTALAEHFEKIGSKAESFADLKTLIFHPEMQHAIMVPGLANAARFNPDYLFSCISNKKWTMKDIIAVGASALFVKTPEGHEIRYQCPDKKVSPEEAYLAKIAYDRLLFLALTEEILSASAARRKLDTNIKAVLKKFTKGAKGLNIGPGPRTLAQWPMVGMIVAENAKNAPGLSLWRGMNTGLDSGQTAEPAQLMPIAASYRSGTLPHWPLWQEGGPGTQCRSKARPVLDILAGPAKKKPDLDGAPAP